MLHPQTQLQSQWHSNSQLPTPYYPTRFSSGPNPSFTPPTKEISMIRNRSLSNTFLSAWNEPLPITAAAIVILNQVAHHPSLWMGFADLGCWDGLLGRVEGYRGLVTFSVVLVTCFDGEDRGRVSCWEMGDMYMHMSITISRARSRDRVSHHTWLDPYPRPLLNKYDRST